MKAKLVKTYRNNRVRIYELSKPIYKGKSDLIGEVCIEESLKELYKRLKPEYKSPPYTKKEGCHYVVISEAHTHIETLVFPAIRVTDSLYAWSHDDICGKHTMMINGGDPSSVYQDEVYLRRLAQLNNYNYEKAPENIYLDPKKVEESEFGIIDAIVSEHRVEKGDIKYTRTDAFIEKAVNFLEMLGHGFTITDKITHTNYDKKQLVNDFKNYMKGE